MCVRDINVTNFSTPSVLLEQQPSCVDSSNNNNVRLGADCISYYTIDCLNTCDANASLYPELVVGGYRVAYECDEEERLLRIEAQTRLCRSEFGAGYCRENAIRKEPPSAEETRKKEPVKYLMECGYDVTLAIENAVEPVVSTTMKPNENYIDSMELLPSKHPLFDCGFTPFNCVVHPLPEEEEELWVDVDFNGWRETEETDSCQESVTIWEDDEVEYAAWWAEGRNGFGSVLIPGLWDNRNDYGQSARNVHRRCMDESKKLKQWKKLLNYWNVVRAHPILKNNRLSDVRRRNTMVKAARITVKMSAKLPQGRHRDHWRQPTFYTLEREENIPRDEQYIPRFGSSSKLRKRTQRDKIERRQYRPASLSYERSTRGSINKRTSISEKSFQLFSEFREARAEQKAKRNRLLPKPMKSNLGEDADEVCFPPVCNPPRTLPHDVIPPPSPPQSRPLQPYHSYREQLTPTDFVEDEHSYQSRLHSYRQHLAEEDDTESFEWLIFDSDFEVMEQASGDIPKLVTQAEDQKDLKLAHLLNSILHSAVLVAGKQSFIYEDKPRYAKRLLLRQMHLDFPAHFLPKPKTVFKPHQVGASKKDKASTKKALQADAGFTKGGTNVVDLNFDFVDNEDPFTSKAEKLKIGIVRILQRYVEYDPKVLPDEDWLMERVMGEWVNEGVGEEGQRRNRCWDYVVEPVPSLPEDRELNPGDGRDAGHAGWSPDHFAGQPEAEAARLTLPEILALRLYTGPAYTILQQSCRSESYEFQVTLFCLECAIVKLGSRNREQFNVFRGVKGQMPAEFQGAYFEDKALAIADKAFISATRDLNIALGPKYGGNIVYAFRCSAPQHAEITFDGWLKGGADVAWISQFPDEQEVLFPRYTELLPFPKAKRWVGWSDEMKRRTSQVEVYEFEPTYHYNEKHTCPNVPGLR
jgi:hypothetical protein